MKNMPITLRVREATYQCIKEHGLLKVDLGSREDTGVIIEEIQLSGPPYPPGTETNQDQITLVVKRMEEDNSKTRSMALALLSPGQKSTITLKYIQ